MNTHIDIVLIADRHDSLQPVLHVFPATLTSVTDGNVNDVWMVRGPEVSKEREISKCQTEKRVLEQFYEQEEYRRPKEYK